MPSAKSVKAARTLCHHPSAHIQFRPSSFPYSRSRLTAFLFTPKPPAHSPTHCRYRLPLSWTPHSLRAKLPGFGLTPGKARLLHSVVVGYHGKSRDDPLTMLSCYCSCPARLARTEIGSLLYDDWLLNVGHIGLLLFL